MGVHIKNSHRLTALHYTSLDGDLREAKELLKNGAQVNITDND